MATSATTSSSLKLLPAYTGHTTLQEALNDPRAVRLLWLEILVNDSLDLAPWQQHEVVRQAQEKAGRWYTSYRSMIDALIDRAPLPKTSGQIDFREYRAFLEALRFAASHR